MSFYTAARDGQIDLLRRYLEGGVDIHQRFNDDRTALHFACDGGNYEVVKLLLEHKADVNLPDVFNKDTPLHLAAEAGHTEIVRLLIEHRSDVNVQDQMNGETPLHLACEGGFTDIVQLLLRTDVDLTVENVYKKTPLHYANEGSSQLIRAFLRENRDGGQPKQGSAHTPGGGGGGGGGGDSQSRSMRRDETNGGGGGGSGFSERGGAGGAGTGAGGGGGGSTSSYVSLGSNRGGAGGGAGVGGGRQSSPSPELYGEGGGGWKEAGSEDEASSSTGWYAAWSVAGQASDGRDKPNQDSFIIVPQLNGDAEVYLFGLFDGHGRNGHLVAAFAKSKLAQLLVSHRIAAATPEGGAHGKGKGVDAAAATQALGGVPGLLADACTSLQSMLEAQEAFDVSASGCTAVIALLVRNVLYVANVGDSRAVLAHVSNPKAPQGPDREQLTVVPLTVDQVPGLKEERERIEECGGQVRRDESTLTGEQGPFRVWRMDMQGPGLAMSRSLGDTIAHEIGVSHLPFVREYRVSETDRLLLLATDGVWDMLENGEAVDIAARASGDCKCDPAHAAEQLCDTAHRAWEFKEARIDDITALLVFLPPPPPAPRRPPPPSPSDALPSRAPPALAAAAAVVRESAPAAAAPSYASSPGGARYVVAASPAVASRGEEEAARRYEDYMQMAQQDVAAEQRRAVPWRGGAGDARGYGAELYEEPERGGLAQYHAASVSSYSAQQQPYASSSGVGYSVTSGYQVREPYRQQYQAQPSAQSPLYHEERYHHEERGPQPTPPRPPQPEPERGLFDGFPGLNLGGGGQREPGQKEEDCVVQ